MFKEIFTARDNRSKSLMLLKRSPGDETINQFKENLCKLSSESILKDSSIDLELSREKCNHVQEGNFDDLLLIMNRDIH